MGATTLDVYALTPERAATLCRFCMRPAALDGEPHYTMDWFKWPNAEVTGLFEKVIGQQLTVSSHLSERFCRPCHLWLLETHEAIQSFKLIDNCWKQYLDILAKENHIKAKPSVIVDAVEDEQPSEFGFKVEYLLDEYECADYDEPATDGQVADTAPSLQIECVAYSVADHDDHGSEPAVTDENPLTQAPHFECDACAEVLVNKMLLSKHFALRHGWRRKYSCESCTKVFENEAALTHHTKVHPSTLAQLQCCSRTFESRYRLMRHQRAVHGPFKPAACTVCHKVFASKPKMYQHMQRHGEKRHVCTQCGLKFHMKKNLKSHCELVHEEQRRFVCDLCGHRVSSKKSLAAHSTRCGKPDQNNRRHCGRAAPALESVRPHLWCVQCDFRCRRPGTLKRHYSEQHPSEDWDALAQCLCQRCIRQFDTTELLAEHLAKHHPTVQCNICKAVLLCELTLERHKKIHTVKERPFKCAVCQGTYVTQHQLKMHHRKLHTNERPFACEQCDRRYAQRCELNTHVRSAHNAGERHPCAHCANSYNSAKNLAMHVARDHTGAYNFIYCKACDRRFGNANELIQHNAVHHPILSD